jgi:hypothetical protein
MEAYRDDKKEGPFKVFSLAAVNIMAKLRTVDSTVKGILRFGTGRNIWETSAMGNQTDSEPLQRLMGLSTRRIGMKAFYTGRYAVCCFPNGDNYKGELKNKCPHGRGTFTLSSGESYDGEWINGVYHGKGSLTFPLVNKLVADFVDGQFNGQHQRLS